MSELEYDIHTVGENSFEVYSSCESSPFLSLSIFLYSLTPISHLLRKPL